MSNLPKLQDLTDQIIAQGSEISTKAEAEEAITWLLAVKDWADETLAKLKDEIAKKSVANDPNFTGVTGDHIKVEYRYFGQPYKISKDFDEALDYDPAFVEKQVKTAYKVISNAVENYYKETGELPKGIEAVPREKTVVIKLLTT